MRQATAYSTRAGNTHKHTRLTTKAIAQVRSSDMAKGSKSQLPKGTADAIKYWDQADNEESIETHLIPRRSLTQQQHLKTYPTEPTTELRQVRVIVKSTQTIVGKIAPVISTKILRGSTTIINGRPFTPITFVTDCDGFVPENYVLTQDEKVVRRGEKTLLNRGRAFIPINDQIESGDFKRLTSRSKRIKNERTDNSHIPDKLTSTTISPDID